MSGAGRILDPEIAGRLAAELFERGFSCAESVVQALLWDDEEASAAGQRMATAFGGGTARRGGTCGALHGAAMAIGYLAGRTSPDDAEGKDRVYALINELYDRVEAARGATECRALTGLDFATPGAQEIFDAEVKGRLCLPLIREVVRLAAALLDSPDAR